jgi:hypothetical protein
MSVVDLLELLMDRRALDNLPADWIAANVANACMWEGITCSESNTSITFV